MRVFLTRVAPEKKTDLSRPKGVLLTKVVL